MSKPRQILPGQFYLITRRCTQSQFLLRPDDETNNAFLYCLIVAAQRHKIDVIMTVAESNHHHTVIFDRYSNCPRFVEDFHKLLARCLNALRGRWENFWAAEEPCITRLLDPGTVLAKVIYSASNPVKDNLVERAHQWPGVTGFTYLISGRPLEARRPRHFFRNPGPMPEKVKLPLTIPSELYPANEFIELVKQGVKAVEAASAQERKRTGRMVLGPRAIRTQSWRASSSAIAPRRNLRPRFAGPAPDKVKALFSYSAFLSAYDDARRKLVDGQKVFFPIGTYWLARFAAVPIAA